MFPALVHDGPPGGAQGEPEAVVEGWSGRGERHGIGPSGGAAAGIGSGPVG